MIASASITATVFGGRLDLAVPADWPEGTEVEISLRLPRGDGNEAHRTPDEIAGAFAAMDACEGIDWSDAERSAWEDSRKLQVERERATFFQRAELLGGQWE